MVRVAIRFYAEINDFLPSARRNCAFEHTVEGTPSMKDVIEALGPPHTEVGAIVVNGAPVPFTYLAHAGDEIAVYAVSAAAGVVAPDQRVDPPIPSDPRFVLDVHLGRLAAYLRMLGFDTRYENFCDDDVLAHISAEEARILLTRDVGLLKRGVVTLGYFVRATQPEAQIAEVIHRYDLLGKIEPFVRCMRCNGLLAPASKDDVADQLPANVRDDYDEYRRCQSCGQVYWRGTHFQRMQGLIARLTQPEPPAGVGL